MAPPGAEKEWRDAPTRRMGRARPVRRKSRPAVRTTTARNRRKSRPAAVRPAARRSWSRRHFLPYRPFRSQRLREVQ